MDLIPKLFSIISSVFVLVTIFFFKIGRKSKEALALIREREDEKETLDGEVGSIKPIQYRLYDLEIATNNFSDNNKVGSGGFGVVYKGVIGRQIVAVKKLGGSSVKFIVDLEKEVSLLSSLENYNLVKLLGFCSEAGQNLLVYEYLLNGDLRNFLSDKTKRLALDWEKRFNIIKGLAHGLCYLHHDSKNKIIHCDLKPENILLDENYNAKITDFGLSRILDMSKTHVTSKSLGGTLGYIAPELWFKQQYSTKTDVYSYGQLVLEILVGCTIQQYAEINQKILAHAVWEQWNAKKSIPEVIDPCLVHTHRQDQIARCIQIGLLCTQHDQKKRPNMMLVLEMLSSDLPLPTPSFPAFFQGVGIDQEQNFQDSNPQTDVHSVRPKDCTTLVDLQPTTLKIYRLRDLKIATNNFSQFNKLWSDTSYAVYEGTLDGQTVAIEEYSRIGDGVTSNLVGIFIEKKKNSKGLFEGKKNLKKELLLLNLRHRNVLQILGYCFEVESKLLLVCEYPRHGRLVDCLIGSNSVRSNCLEWRTCLKIIKGIAEGICYLHHGLRDKYIIHANLKPHNILLDETWNAKIANFSLSGISGMMKTTTSNTLLYGSLGYMAPEMTHQQQYSTKSDVYSYGVIVLEILTGWSWGGFHEKQITHHAFAEENYIHLVSAVWKHWLANKPLEMIDPYLRSQGCVEEILRCLQIALLCLQYYPMKRPNMEQVVHMLNSDDNLPIPTGLLYLTLSNNQV